jgi:hypothetical protein
MFLFDLFLNQSSALSATNAVQWKWNPIAESLYLVVPLVPGWPSMAQKLGIPVPSLPELSAS